MVWNPKLQGLAPGVLIHPEGSESVVTVRPGSPIPRCAQKWLNQLEETCIVLLPPRGSDRPPGTIGGGGVSVAGEMANQP